MQNARTSTIAILSASATIGLASWHIEYGIVSAITALIILSLVTVEFSESESE